MSENWERIQSLFLEAIDLPPTERSSFLDTACAGDEQVRREVESLIAHDSRDEHRITAALEDAAQSLFESENVSGMRLGAWRVIKEIGRGGMGTVYLACRDDDQFQKHVAIKVVKRGMDTAELLSRFRHERQILAQLDHPFIARLIDSGNTPQGRPFLVMEYVQGRPIDAYCRQDGLDVVARCRLFLKVCQAVSYAHRNLVIHRDLKPGNILVATDGSPKLLDFGVAKLLDPETDPGMATTIATGRLLTPEYASPEQVRGELVGAASDIYALGAILYELLAGVKAQQLTTHTPSELERVICQTEVQPPSIRIEPGNVRLRKRLEGDLDTIVLKAMRKEPDERYSSVDLFYKDINRHLKGRTITARPPSLTYRFGKFARRHKFSMAAAVLVIISMVVGTWISLVEARRARLEQHRAEARLSQMVELANRALFDVHGSIERLPGATDARRQLVKTTLDYLENLSKEASGDQRLNKALGAAYYRLGDLQGYPYKPNLGDTAGAIKSYWSSATLLDPIRRAHPQDAEAQRLWLETQKHLAELLYSTGDSAAASKLLHDALPVGAAFAKLPDGGVEGQRIQGEIYGILANSDGKLNPGEQLPNARGYLEIFSGLAARLPDHGDFVLEQANAYALMGNLLLRQGDSQGALEPYLRCLKLREKLVKDHPNDVVYKRNLMIGYGHVGDVLGNPVMLSLGDSAGARANYGKAVAIAEEISNADPNDLTAKYDLAASLQRLGMVDVPASEMAESLATLQRSASMLESIVASDPRNVRRGKTLSLTLEYVGHRLQSLGRYREAISNYQRSLTMANVELAADPADRSAMSQAIASGRGVAAALASSGDRAGALRQAQATVAKAEGYFKNGSDKRSGQRYVATSTMELGSIYEILAKHSPASQQKRNWEAAREALGRSVSLFEAMAADSKLLGFDADNLQNSRNLLAEAEAHLFLPPQKGH